MPRKKQTPSLFNILFQRKKTKRQKAQTWSIQASEKIAKEVQSLVYIGLSILVLLSISGNLGIIGTKIQEFLQPIFGYGLIIVPLVLIATGVYQLLNPKFTINLARQSFLGLFTISFLSLLHLPIPVNELYNFAQQGTYGGYIGFLTNFLFREILQIGKFGAGVIFTISFLISSMLTFNISLNQVLTTLSSIFLQKSKPLKAGSAKTQAKAEKLPEFDFQRSQQDTIKIIKPNISPSKAPKAPLPNQTTLDEQLAVLNKPKEFKPSDQGQSETLSTSYKWESPNIELLENAQAKILTKDHELRKKASSIANKLEQFDIQVNMQDVHVGPTVIQYTLKPDAGVKLSKIVNLKNDLALALAAKSIRIEAPIPGKSLVGIEVPAEKRISVRLKEILISPEYQAAKKESKLVLPLGRNVAGVPIVTKLEDMPHMLIAGATNSGKSVGINTFLISLLYQNSPADLKMILVDPKQVELSDYNGIPHLLTPVITDPNKAANALKWAVAEMNRRYTTLKTAGCRNIAEYNSQNEQKMPYILILIDELADLMMANGKEIEGSICRLAQMARAVGMHLIIATQRPSVDVITGLIKSNIPCRISFAVSSSIDSRTILDTTGAEELLGKGDMLYLAKDYSKPLRIQGIYTAPLEIKKVVNQLKLKMAPDYHEGIVEKSSNLQNGGGAENDPNQEDSLYQSAYEVVVKNQKASASLLQRRLKVGYARAARLLDLLEDNGIVGPVNGAKPREIFIETSPSSN